MNDLIRRISNLVRNKNTRRQLRRVVSLTACLVVFVTTYALVLPAITMERVALCGLEAHEHSADCYGRVLVCGKVESGEHRHSEACYQEALVCGKAVHIHSADCYKGSNPYGGEESVSENPAGSAEYSAGEGAEKDAAQAGETGLQQGVLPESPEGTGAGDDNSYGTGDTETVNIPGPGQAADSGGSGEDGSSEGSSSYEKNDSAETGNAGAGAAGTGNAAAVSDGNEGESGQGNDGAGSGIGENAEDALLSGSDSAETALTEEGAASGNTGPAEEYLQDSESLDGQQGEGTDYTDLENADPESASSEDSEDQGLSEEDEIRNGGVDSETGEAPEAEEAVQEEKVSATIYEATIRVKTGRMTAGGEVGADAAVSLLPEEADVTVRAEAEPGTFPEGTEMVISSVEGHALDEVAESVAGAVSTQQGRRSGGFQAVDISFRGADGKEIEPARPIRVTMTSEAIRTAAEDNPIDGLHVVHVDDRGKGEEIPQLAIEPAAEETAGSGENSVEGAKNSPLSEETAGSGENSVEGAENSPLSEETAGSGENSVEGAENSPLSEENAGFGETSPEGADAERFSEEIEGEDPAADLTSEESFAEDTGTVEKTRDTDSAVMFEADRFSVYALVYTVDFYWEVNGRTYEVSIGGGDTASFRALVETLHILDSDPVSRTRNTAAETDINKFIGDIEAIRFSDESLIKPVQITEDTTAGALKEKMNLEPVYSADLTQAQIAALNAKNLTAPDWALISLKPFDTGESLTVTMKTGEEFSIRVTDDQAGDPWGLNNESFVITNGTHDRSLKAQADSVSGSLQAQNPPSADAINIWKFEYDHEAFDGQGGYYIVSVVNGVNRYLRVEGNNLSLAPVKYEEEAEEGQTFASPFHIAYDHELLRYRISAAVDGNSRFLNFTATQGNGRFNISNTKADSNLLALRDKEHPASTPGTIGTWDILSDSIVLKLFDYSGTVKPTTGSHANQTTNIDDVWGSDVTNTQLRNGAGINHNHSLLFSGSGLGNDEAFNNFTGDKTGGTYYSGYAYQNIVNYNLGSDRFPVLQSDKIKTDTDRRAGGSLSYLFNNNNINNAKTVYAGDNNKGLQGLLRKNEEGYYYYDSEENFAKLVGNEVILYSDTYKKNNSSSTDIKTSKIGLFPFDDYQSGQGEEKGPSGSVYDHQFGMTISTGFVYPPNGVVPSTGKDMTFKFSGDDDVWVFVDGVLVLDLGGVHQPISGKINFASGDVEITEFGSDGREYRSTKSTSISQMFTKASREAGRTITFDDTDYSSHKLEFFYLERGGCDSNCRISFNLLLMKTLAIAKKLNGLTPAERQKYLEDEFLYELAFKQNDDGVEMAYDDDEDYWGNPAEWRTGFSTYNTADPNAQSTENYTVKRLKNGTEQAGVPIKDGQIRLKDGESMLITHLPKTDIFYLAEEDQLDMQQFETPHAERLYMDDSDQKRHEEEVYLHEDTAAGGTHQSDWETKPYALMDTESLVYTNTLQEKNLDVEKIWSDGKEKHANDSVRFRLRAAVEGQDYADYMASHGYPAYTDINAQWTETRDNVTTTYTGEVLSREFTLDRGNDWKLSFEHLPRKTQAPNDTGKEIVYTVEEVTETAGYSSTVGVTKDINRTYLDIFKFWPDDNSNHDGSTAEKKAEHIRTLVRRSDGKYLQAQRLENGEYRVTGYGDKGTATSFLLTSMMELQRTNSAYYLNLKTSDQYAMLDYAARVNDLEKMDEDGNDYVYTLEQVSDEDPATTGLVLFNRPVQEIEIRNDTMQIDVIKRWVDVDGNTLEDHPGSIAFDIWQVRHVHEWSDWTVKKAATETRPGEETRICGHCGQEETRTIDAGGHDFVYQRTVAPACADEGYDLYVCKKDPGHVERRNIRAASGHAWVARDRAQIIQQPTCTRDGLRQYTCTHEGCSHVLLEAVPAAGHSWGAWSYTKEPTDTKKGEISRTCRTCSEVETREIEKGQVLPVDPPAQQQTLPAEPVPYIPESMESYDDPAKGTSIELYSFNITMDTKDADEEPDSRTRVTDSDGSVYWTTAYNLPKYDSNGVEYAYCITEHNPGSAYAVTYTCYSGTFDEQQDRIVYTETEDTALQDHGRVDITNTESAEILLFKTDDKGKNLAGASFKLTTGTHDTVVPVKTQEDSGHENLTGAVTVTALDEDETVTISEDHKSFTVPAHGVRISGLKKGDYKLVELTAPDGYIIENPATAFTIRDGKAYMDSKEVKDSEITVINTPGAELPATGGPGTRLLCLAGTLLVLLAAAGLRMSH